MAATIISSKFQILLPKEVRKKLYLMSKDDLALRRPNLQPVPDTVIEDRR